MSVKAPESGYQNFSTCSAIDSKSSERTPTSDNFTGIPNDREKASVRTIAFSAVSVQ